jgi:hypothetical protein
MLLATRPAAVLLRKVLRVIIYGVLEAVSLSGRGSRSFDGVSAGKATLKKQTIISSKLCCPQVTVLLGSGFSGFLAELS